MTDPIADMITRIRNGYLVKKHEVLVPSSRFKQALAEVLVREGYLSSVEKISIDSLPPSPRVSKRAAKRGRSDLLRLQLRYTNEGRPAAVELTRISKPSRRVYVGKNDTPVVRSGLGIAILSTSPGLMTSREAKKAGVGGELICQLF